MTLTLEHLPLAKSPLSRLDPRRKLASLLLAMLGLALLRTLPPVSAAFGAALLLSVACRQPVRWYVKRFGTLFLFVFLFAGAMPLLLEGPGAIWEIGGVTFSEHGLRASGVLMFKTLGIVLLAATLLLTAPLHVTLQAAHRLQIPGILVQLLGLTYRYLFVLSGELARLRTAVRVRGFRARPSRHTYRTVAHVAGTLLVRGSERAERVSQAMRCRGFDGSFRSLGEFQTRSVDVIFFLLVTSCTLGLVFWDWSLR